PRHRNGATLHHKTTGSANRRDRPRPKRNCHALAAGRAAVPSGERDLGMSQHVVRTVGAPAHLTEGPFAVAVVIPTVRRGSLVRAVRSVYAQDIAGTIQVLIGIDQPLGDGSALTQIERECPAHCLLSVFDLGYSTSVRHGGLHPSHDGGVLRTLLSYAAHSRYVAYLDDDNWWAPNHL